MQSALDAKAFASITDSVTQLLLLREVLCTSELSTTTTAGEALQNSATSDHRASGACWDCALSQASPLCRCCLDVMERGKVSYGQNIIDTGMRLPCLERTPDVVHSREARIASSPTLLPGHMLRLGCIVAGRRTMNWLPGQQDRRTRAGTWSMSGVPHLPAT